MRNLGSTTFLHAQEGWRVYTSAACSLRNVHPHGWRWASLRGWSPGEVKNNVIPQRIMILLVLSAEEIACILPLSLSNILWLLLLPLDPPMAAFLLFLRIVSILILSSCALVSVLVPWYCVLMYIRGIQKKWYKCETICKAEIATQM